jgi:5-formyltetrahydrofolate cyclo-ligase
MPPGDPPVADKAALRRAVNARRRALAPAQRAVEAEAASVALLAFIARVRPASLASHLALPDELDLDAVHRAWWAAGNILHLPRVLDDGGLAWHAVTDAGQCRPGAFGIREPDPALAPLGPLPATAVVLVPGVAFAADGARLGRGRGFYDRVLAVHGGLSIGVGFACQEVASIPGETHDRHVAAVLLAGHWLRQPQT